MLKVIVINGPNLNLLGRRQPEIYGSESFEEYWKKLLVKYKGKVKLTCFQSNHEGYLIDKIQKIGFHYDGIILNAAGYTHTSIAIADTISAISTPVIEVHISNIYNREKFRHHSYLKDVCHSSIIGHGLSGYDMAIDVFLKKQLT